MTILIPYAGKEPNERPRRERRPHPRDWEWTDAKLEILKERWKDGHSAGLIADEIGASRNAVIGKLHRLGLSGRGLPDWQLERRERRAPDRPIASALRGDAQRIRRANGHALVPEPQPRPAQLVCEPVALVARRRTQCAYPLEEPSATMLVCGAATHDETSWCEYHARICIPGMFQPNPSRRKAA